MSRGKIHDEGKRIGEYQFSGDALIAYVKGLMPSGNNRHISSTNEEDKSLIEITRTLGVVSPLLLSARVAIGTNEAMLANCTIVVEKAEEWGEGLAGTFQHVHHQSWKMRGFHSWSKKDR